MTAEQAREALTRAIEESARLIRKPPSRARDARLAQLDREKRRLVRLYREVKRERSHVREERIR